MLNIGLVHPAFNPIWVATAESVLHGDLAGSFMPDARPAATLSICQGLGPDRHLTSLCSQ